MMAVWGLPVSLVLVFLSVGMGYRSGAPRQACVTMQPGHTNTVAMATESPYHLEVHQLNSPDGYVVVSMTGSSSFKGFFLQARDANSSSTDAVGSFPAAGFIGGSSETVSCNDVGDSALTHTNPGMKAAVIGTWKAPDNESVKAVYFIATVVRSFDEYWVGILSSTIRLTGRQTGQDKVTEDIPTYTAINTTPSSGRTSTITTTDSAPSSSHGGNPEFTTALPVGVTRETYSPSITEDTNSNPKGDSGNLSTPATMDDPNRSSTGWSISSRSTTNKNEAAYDVLESTTPDQRSHVTTDSILDKFTRHTVSKRRTSTAVDSSTLADFSTPAIDSSTPVEVSTRVERTTTPIQQRTQFTQTTFKSTTRSPLSTVVEFSRPVNSSTPTQVDVSRRFEMSTTPSETTNKLMDDLTSIRSSTTLQPQTQLTHLSSVSTTESPLTIASSTPVHVEMSTHVEVSTTPYETTLSEIVNDSDSSYTISSATLQPRTQLTHLPLESTTDSPLGTIITHDFQGTSTTTTKPKVSSETDTLTGTNYHTTPLGEDISTVEPVQSTSEVSSNESTTLSSEGVKDYPHSSTDPTTLPVNNSTESHYSQTKETVGLETDSQYNATTLEVSTLDTITKDTATYGSSDNDTTRQMTEAPTKSSTDASTTFSKSHASTTQPHEESTTPSELITLSYNSSTAQVNLSTASQVHNATELPDTTSEIPLVNTSTSATVIVNSSTPSSVDTSATQPSVSSPGGSSPPPTNSSTTAEVPPNPPVNSSMSQSTTDGTTEPLTTTAETTPVTISTTPLAPQITEEVTVFVTEDSTEVMQSLTSMGHAELSTRVPTAAATEGVTQGTVSSSVITEEPNEVRLQLRIVEISFTEELRDPNSDAFKRVANDVEQAVWDVYMQNNVTTLERVKVLRITRGSVVPEVQLRASQDLDAASKSTWLSVLYNEISSGGKLGNFSVSDISALSADGTFTEVDPCFILPCPQSMVCFIYQSTCLSNCFLNTNYCMNDGVCSEPMGDTQLMSCSCSSNYEGERCEVTKVPVTPDTGASNVNSLFAILWGSIGAACFVTIVVCAAWLIRRRRKGNSWRHTAKLMGSRESGLSPHSRAAQMDSYAQHLTSIRAGVLIDLANISISASEDGSNDARRRSRSASFTTSDTESLDQQPRFIDGGVHIGGMPDILQGASTTDYELDIMNRPLNPKSKSVGFNDVTEMIDFVATENFTLANKDDANGNFQVRWDFQVDSSQSRGASTS